MESEKSPICVVVVRKDGQKIVNVPMRFPTYPHVKDQISFKFGGHEYYCVVEGRLFNDPGTPDENVVLYCERY